MRRRPRQIEGVVQPQAVNANELVCLPIGFGAGDDRQGGVEQNRGQIEPLAFSAMMVRYLAQNFQQRRQHATTSDSGSRLYPAGNHKTAIKAFLGLTRDEWEKHKNKAYKSRAGAIEHFDIKIAMD